MEVCIYLFYDIQAWIITCTFPSFCKNIFICLDDIYINKWWKILTSNVIHTESYTNFSIVYIIPSTQIQEIMESANKKKTW